MVMPKNTTRRPQCFSGGRKPRHTTADLGKNTMQMYRTSQLSQNEKFSMRKLSSDYAWKIGYTMHNGCETVERNEDCKSVLMRMRSKQVRQMTWPCSGHSFYCSWHSDGTVWTPRQLGACCALGDRLAGQERQRQSFSATAACIMEGPWISLYHRLLRCSLSHERLTL